MSLCLIISLGTDLTLTQDVDPFHGIDYVPIMTDDELGSDLIHTIQIVQQTKDGLLVEVTAQLIQDRQSRPLPS